MYRAPKLGRLAAVACLCAAIYPAGGHAVPLQIPYVAFLDTLGGAPFNGTVALEIGLYATANPDPAVDAALWGPEEHLTVSVQAGILSIVLGDVGSPIDSAVLAQDAVWLSVTLNGTLMTPAQRVLSVPFAVRSSDSVRLGGLEAADFLTAPDLVDLGYLLANDAATSYAAKATESDVAALQAALAQLTSTVEDLQLQVGSLEQCCDATAPPVDCATSPNGTACDDGDVCTINEVCAQGICVGQPASCDDGNPCTDDGCDSLAGCQFAPNSIACDDGNACTQVDACANGTCAGSSPVTCNDGNSCTTDSCVPATGACSAAPIADCCGNGLVEAPEECDDGNQVSGDGCADSCIQTSLYPFVTHEFTPCGKAGQDGPALAQCRAAYTTSWDEDPSIFTMTTAGVQRWVVPAPGLYRIEAAGAAGGVGDTAASHTAGGRGARVMGDYVLQAGDVLNIVIGQAGTNGPGSNPAGGGGGTFAYFDSAPLPLIAAGGGAGGGSCGGVAGLDATVSNSGVSALGGNGNGFGGSNGGAGAIDTQNNHSGGPGAGWLASAPHRTGAFGNSSSSIHSGDGGDSQVDGWRGGNPGAGGPGGFGGGGGGATCSGSGGGGGGYSGGGSGGGGGGASGGGGSYNPGANPQSSVDTTGAGHLRITWLPALCTFNPPSFCDDANPCTTDGCDAGTGQCTHSPVLDCCGNGILEAAEACDDGNSISTDSCSGCVLTDLPGLFAFSSHTFTTCGQSGASGPSLSQCRSTYSTIWDEDGSFFGMAVNGVQRFTVPTSGNYRIAVSGGQGGLGNPNGGGGNAGGLAATMSGEFFLEEGTALQIVVGQQGVNDTTNNPGGGGGGSFVYIDTAGLPLIAAGGGGGGSACGSSPGLAASTTTSGVTASGGNANGYGGVYGGAGAIDTQNNHSGGPGAGWLESAPHRTGAFGNSSSSIHGGDGGNSWVDGWTGGAPSGGGPGGFGGGGGAATCGGSGGAGGGFSGGGSGGGSSTSSGGGGSYNGGLDQSNAVDHSGHGSVTITRLP